MKDFFEEEIGIPVRCFDTVRLNKAGEYIIRGCIELNEGIEGVFEPLIKKDANCEKEEANNERIAWITASGVVRVDSRKHIPIRIWTFEDNVKLTKGMQIGYFSIFSQKEVQNETGEESRINLLSQMNNQKEERWNILEPKFREQLGQLSKTENQVITPLLQEFVDIFSVDKNDIGLTNIVQHEIDTGTERPIACPYRRVPMQLEDKVEEMIHSLESKGIIRPSESPWNAPLVIVPKKNGDIRLTVDYRKLNAVTKRPIFPIPETRQLLDTLHGSVYFTTLDLSSGYYNVPMAEKDIEKTAFSTRKNHWEFVRMPMGLSTSPSTFQKLMHKAFDKENWHQCLIYLDDILIFSKDLEEQAQRLRIIFERVRAAGFKLSPEKCEFMKNQVSYLGYTISKEGTKTDTKKIERIQNWKRPESAEELRSWLGLCGYYRQFIKDYAKLAAPLENLCKKIWNKKSRRSKSIIEWDEVCTKSFNQLKIALTSAPVLSYPTKEGKFILDTDASHDCMGSVLSQIQDGQEKVIAYASKKFSQSERQYCITRKELLSVYHFVNHFRHYLLGRSFMVRTDHRALTWMLNWKNPNTSQYCRWRQELEVYDMEVRYRRGEDHANADALSRLPQCQQCELKHPDPKRKARVKNVGDKDNGELFCRNILTFEHELDQTSDENLAEIIKLLKTRRICETEPFDIRSKGIEAIALWKRRTQLRFRGGLLYLLDSNNNYRLLLPKSSRQEIIRMTHENFAHIGIKKTLKLLSEKYYWMNMEIDVKTVIGSCKSCMKRKNDPVVKCNNESLQGYYPFQKISLDVTGPLPRSSNGDAYILGIIDNFSRFVVLVPLKRATGEEVAKALYNRWITIFGAPESIHSDRGTEFQNEVVSELCKLFGIKKTKSSPYYPQGNAIVERLFRTVKDMIFTTTNSTRKSWSEVIPTIEMALRCTEHNYLKFSPYEVIFGRKMSTPLYDGWEPKTKQNMCGYIISLQKNMYDIHKTILESMEKQVRENSIKREKFEIGNMVMAKILPCARGIDKARFDGPYKIVEQRGRCYVLKHLKNKKVIERNIHHMKKIADEARTSKMECSTRSKEVSTSIESQTRRGEEWPPTRECIEEGNNFVRRYPIRVRRPTDRYGLTQ